MNGSSNGRVSAIFKRRFWTTQVETSSGKLLSVFGSIRSIRSIPFDRVLDTSSFRFPL